MRLCIIGPSHIAALRTAERNGLVALGGHDITYMGHVWWVFANIRLDGTRLFSDIDPPVQPLAPDLLTEVTVTDYDALFVHGLAKPVSRFTADAGVRQANYSENMRRKLAAAALRQSGAMKWISGIREVFEGPILVSSQPEKAVPPGTTVEDTGNEESEAFNGLLCEALEEQGIIYLPQPTETVLNGQYTRREYSQGSVKLGNGDRHAEEDLWHMNEKYGALVFREFLDELQGPDESDVKFAS